MGIHRAQRQGCLIGKNGRRDGGRSRQCTKRCVTAAESNAPHARTRGWAAATPRGEQMREFVQCWATQLWATTASYTVEMGQPAPRRAIPCGGRGGHAHRIIHCISTCPFPPLLPHVRPTSDCADALIGAKRCTRVSQLGEDRTSE